LREGIGEMEQRLAARSQADRLYICSAAYPVLEAAGDLQPKPIEGKRAGSDPDACQSAWISPRGLDGRSVLW
jgi:hypothetical protein